MTLSRKAKANDKNETQSQLSITRFGTRAKKSGEVKVRSKKITENTKTTPSVVITEDFQSTTQTVTPIRNKGHRSRSHVSPSGHTPKSKRILVELEQKNVIKDNIIVKMESSNIKEKVIETFGQGKEATDESVSLEEWIKENKEELVVKNMEIHTPNLLESTSNVDNEPLITPPPLDSADSDTAPLVIVPVQLAAPIKSTPSAHTLLVARRLGIPDNILKLSLPRSALFLEQLLSVLDHVIAIAASRSQPVVFARLIRPLETSLKRRVTTEHFDAIKAIWKESYLSEPCKSVIDGRLMRSYRLSIPVLEKEQELTKNSNPISLASMPSNLIRSVLFRWNIVKYIHEYYHVPCLKKAEIDPNAFSLNNLKEWHPHLNLDIISFTHNKDEMINQQDSMLEKENELEKEKQQKTNTKLVPSLLERIRQKERRKTLEQMTKSNSLKLNEGHLKELGDCIDRIIICFSSQKRSSILETELLERTSLSKATFETIVNALPEWISRFYADDMNKIGPMVVSINKGFTLAYLKQKLALYLKQGS